MPEEPLDIGATLQAAMEHHRQGRLREAEALYQRIIEAAPEHFGARNLLGIMALQEGRLERALTLLARAAEIDPGFAATRGHLGLALRRLGRAEEAVANYDRALELGLAGDADLHNKRGVALLDLRRFEAALNSFDTALSLDPQASSAHYNRAGALMELGRVEEALASYDAALARQPNYAQALNNRSQALVKLGRLDEALASVEAAVALQPERTALHYSRADVLARLGRRENALESLDRAIKLDPTFTQARWNRALALLALQRFKAGWADYEQRWGDAAFVAGSSGQVTDALRARLDPGLKVSDLTGRRVLLVGEQGVGDVLMFASVIPDLLAVARAVSLVCDPRLRRLLGHAFPQLELPPPGAATPEADVVVAIGSLGRLFRNRLEDFPGTPFLTVPEAVRQRWSQRLGPAEGRLRVGISWRGGIDRTGRNARSMPLAQLRPLLDLPGCEFVSLQYGDVAEEVAAENAGRVQPIRIFPPGEFSDFEDLAGLVRSLDLVVTVQTTLAHLAGGLGAPALVMIPSQAEWRYGVASASMPWYGSVTLLRQGEDGDWAPVVQRVCEAVTNLRNQGFRPSS